MKTNIFMGFRVAFLLLSGAAVWAAPVTTLEIGKSLDALNDSLTVMEDYGASTVLGKSSSPLNVNGEIVTRLKDNYYSDPNAMLAADVARSQMEAQLNVFMSAQPNSYVNLWTRLSMQYDFSGVYSNSLAYDPNGLSTADLERVVEHHNIDGGSATLYEEMTAGIDLRSSAFGAMFKAGGVLWVNSSPLTIYERDVAPRFTSTYETWEEERNVSRYYREKNFRPVKGGRTFWVNRPFGGVMLDIYRLPWDLSAQVMLGQPKDQYRGTRDGSTLYAYLPGDAEMAGTLNLRGQVLHARVAKNKLWGGASVGLNLVDMRFDPEIIYESEFRAPFVDRSPEYINARVLSLDYKGEVLDEIYMEVDVGVSQDDTVRFRQQQTESGNNFYRHDRVIERQSDPTPGVYGKLVSRRWSVGDLLLPMSVEGVYLPKNFNSPYGLADDSRNLGWRKDEMYLNAGAFRYQPNLMGLNFKIEPNFNRGRFHLNYAQHRQVEPGKDHLVFEHRLNGRKVWESLSSWSKFNSMLAIDSGRSVPEYKDNFYRKRLGLEELSSSVKGSRQDGGLRGGTWEIWEEFTAWESVEDLEMRDVPMHQKWSNYLSFDMGYDIGHWFGTDKAVMLTANVAWSGISTDMLPLAYSSNQKGMLLQSFFVQSEPAIALTPSFHLLGLLGFETWQGELAYAKQAFNAQGVTVAEVVTRVPIDYQQTAWGFGFDWDYSDRAGVHVRFRQASHRDRFLSDNNWAGRFVTVESKLWF